MFIDVDKNTEYVVKGGSKFFGAPDVDVDFEWPYIIDGDDEFDLEFLCQLNCEELNDKCHTSLGKGILYFFIDPLSEMWCDENKNAVKVIYSSADINDLDYIDSIDQNGESIGSRELKIDFENCALRNTRKMMEVMSYDNDIVVLLKLTSDLLAQGGMELPDDSFLVIYAAKKDVENGNFSDVKAKVVRI